MYEIIDKFLLSHINFETLGILFCLMAVAEGLRRLGYIDKAAKAVGNLARSMADLMLLLVLLCFVVSMLVTNDVALIIFVPFTIQVLTGIERKDKAIKCIVLETIAANLGSMVTPFGNPQNVYLYRTYEMQLGAFLKTILPYGILALILLVIIVKLDKNAKEPVNFSESGELPSDSGNLKGQNKKNISKTAAYMVLFVLSILAVIGIVPWYLVFVFVLAVVVIMDRKVLRALNYGLLSKFIVLFVLVGNVAALEVISSFLEQVVNGNEVVAGIALSQIISNVPAAVLLSKFTGNGMALMLGCNIGGLGTLIASMASMISLEFYGLMQGAEKKKYVLAFTGYNLLFLAVMVVGLLLL